ncbi:MAG: 30S ribosomal protein S20 [Ghiorsea sp.]|nr:30S ribosomal protein S20 [Ghiorsea sp.]
MANHVSALKRARQDIKKRDQNRAQKSTMRTAIKRVQQAIEAGDQKLANEAMVTATSLIARAGRKGIMHAKTASRSISRLNADIKGLKA